MGWFGRAPRKVGFGMTEAKPIPPKPSKYVIPKPPSQNKAWDSSSSDQGNGTVQRNPGAVANRQAQQQIAELKKRAPWLGGVAERMAKAQDQSADSDAVPAKRPRGRSIMSSFLTFLVIIAIAFVLLSDVLSEIILNVSQ